MIISDVHPKSLVGLAIDIRNIARAGSSTDDDPYSLRQIIHWISTTASIIRAESLKEDSAMANELRRDWVEEFTCIPLKPIDRSHCDCIKYGCMEKYVELPDFAIFNGRLAITYLGRSDWNLPYKRAIDAHDASIIAMGVGRFGKANRTPAYYIQSKKAYIVFPPEYSLTTTVSMSGVVISPVPSNPTNLTLVDGVLLEDDIWCSPISLDDDEIYQVRNRILSAEMNMMVRADQNHDETNNSNRK